MTKPTRQLPAHIQAALDEQRARIDRGENLTDTVGQPWEGRTFEHSSPQEPDDDGAADPDFARVLSAWSAGDADEVAVVEALADVRLLIPAKAVHAELPESFSESELSADSEHAGHPHAEGGHSSAGACSHGDGDDASHSHGAGDKAADMMICSLTAPDGRKALPVFTSAQALSDWDPEARPIPVDARRLALSCVQDGAQLFVIDPGAGANFVARRPAVWSLAKGEPWTPSYDDPVVARELRALAAELDGVTALLPARGARVNTVTPDGSVTRGGGLGPELECHVFLPGGLDRDSLAALMQRISAAISSSTVLQEKADSLSVKILDAALLD